MSDWKECKLGDIIDTISETYKFSNEEGIVFGSISKTDFQQMEIVLSPENLIEKFKKETKSL